MENNLHCIDALKRGKPFANHKNASGKFSGELPKTVTKKMSKMDFIKHFCVKSYTYFGNVIELVYQITHLFMKSL